MNFLHAFKMSMQISFNYSDYNQNNYKVQLDEKVNRLTELFQPFISDNQIHLEVFSSEIVNYRMRCEFRVWHEGDDFNYIMFDKSTKSIIHLTQFPPASLLINKTMSLLKQMIIGNEELKRKLFQVDFLSTTTNEILISLIYHKDLTENWTLQALELERKLETILKDDFLNVKVKVLGRARKQKIVLSEDFVWEQFIRHEQFIYYKQVENSFTQPNAMVAQKMLNWSLRQTKNSSGDLLEMYCGNGNFSLFLAENFKRVLATEISASSVAAAQDNISKNSISNVDILRLSAEEFTMAINKERSFRRLAHIDLESYNCETILVDPPRSGLDEKSVKMVSNYKRILYISCNPDTLIENLKILTQTHRLKAYALFDQFPYTHHMEAAVVLEAL